MSQKWKLMKNVWISPKPVLPGVWQRKEGGHVVRARATEKTTGRQREIFKVLPMSTKEEAVSFLAKERERVRAGVVSHLPQRTRFAEFAATLFDEKKAAREIKSAKGRERWRYTLVHLIEGTDGESGGSVEGFGDFFIDMLRSEHFEKWKAGVGALITAGDYAPSTCNGWLAILRVIMKAAKRRFQLPHLATDDVKDFDTSEHATYTEEEPNALTTDEVPLFLAKMLELYPQHYAMTYLGFAAGWRPSSLRPLRRKGAEPDVLWGQARLLVRRSQTLGDEVMNTTKQKRRYSVEVPTEVMTVLRWHVETQLVTPEMKESDLLFPSVTGGFRSPSVLNKPFADVAEELGLGKKFTQRGLRRTFNDLARAVEVEGVVTRSISGHLTEQMQEHYSTVLGAEQKTALGKVVSLFRAPSGEHGGEQPPRSGEHVA